MIEKIIYIGYMPLTDKVIDDFYINDALLNNYKVEYWDLTTFFFPNVFSIKRKPQPYEVSLKNLEQFKIRIQTLDISKVLFIVNFTYTFRVRNIFLILTQYDCKTGYFARGALPHIKSDNFEFIGRLIALIINPKKCLNLFKNKVAQIILKVGLIKPYDIVFNSGYKGFETIGYYSKKLSSSILVDINYFDFDVFAKEKSSSRPIVEKYCVFHDEYLPHHPDFFMLGMTTVSSDLYYKTLNTFFDLIEQIFELKVIIAAHPKAEKYKSYDMFNQRSVYFNKISSLIQFSEFSILHASSSVSYAILNKKSCIFITSDSISDNMPSHNKWIRSFADVLGQSFINIDTVTKSNLLITPVNSIKYDSYKYNYLTSKKSEKQSTKDIFLSKLLDL